MIAIYFGGARGVCSCSIRRSPIRRWTGPLQCKCRVLTSGPPGRSRTTANLREGKGTVRKERAGFKPPTVEARWTRASHPALFAESSSMQLVKPCAPSTWAGSRSGPSLRASLVAQLVKNPSAKNEMKRKRKQRIHLQCQRHQFDHWVGKMPWRRERQNTSVLLGFPGSSTGKGICLHCGRSGFDPWIGKIPWRRALATHSSVLPWRIPWTKEPGGLQSTGLQRVRHNWVTKKRTLLQRSFPDFSQTRLPHTPPWPPHALPDCQPWRPFLTPCFSPTTPSFPSHQALIALLLVFFTQGSHVSSICHAQKNM